MKLLHILFLLTALINFAYAQENLVPNPSFEEYSQCPDGWNMGSDFYVDSWQSINGTPDYFNACFIENSDGGGTPCNIAGCQYVNDGNGYIGVVTYLSNAIFSVREYVRAELNAPLEVGKQYFISMNVSPSIRDIICYLSNNIGLRFTNRNDSYNFSVENFAQIYCDIIITDTLNWTKISGSFVADSAYRYLVIGNFFDDAHTNVVGCNMNNSTAYYYIDMVSVSTDSATSINDGVLDTEIIEVYPNPATNIININNTQLSNLFILFDSAGRKITEGELADGINMIDVSKYDRGLYFLQVDNSVTKISFIN